MRKDNNKKSLSYLFIFFLSIIIFVIILINILNQKEDKITDTKENKPAISHKNKRKQIFTLEKINREWLSPEKDIQYNPLIQKEKIVKALLENDYCSIYDQQTLSTVNINYLFKQLDSKTNLVGYQELNEKSMKSLFSAFDNDASRLDDGYSAELIFFNALYQAGLLYGVEKKRIDIDYAISLMEWSRDLDNENGVYSFYLAHLKELAQYPEEQVLEEYQDLFTKSFFSNHVLKISRYNLVKGLTSEVYFVLAVYLNSQIPSPDMLSPWNTLKKHMKKQDSLFLKKSLKFSNQLQVEGIKYGRTHQEFSFWDAISFAIGSQIKKQVKKLNPQLLPDKIPHYTDLVYSYQQTRKEWSEELQPGDCPSQSSFRKMLIKERDLFKSFYLEKQKNSSKAFFE